MVGAPVALAISFAARMTLGNEAPLTAIFWLSYAAVMAGYVAMRGRPRSRTALATPA